MDFETAEVLLQEGAGFLAGGGGRRFTAWSFVLGACFLGIPGSFSQENGFPEDPRRGVLGLINGDSSRDESEENDGDEDRDGVRRVVGRIGVGNVSIWAGPLKALGEAMTFQRHRYTDGCDVKTWEKFKHELQRQFYLDSIDDKPSTAEAEGSIHEYVKEYSALMLKIPEMSERQRLCFFVDGLQYWVAKELRRREPHNLASAMMIVERLGDFKQCERPRSPRHDRAKGRGDGRSKSGSPKATDDERNGDEP
ncbi:hypothetical protein RJ639_031170 [Escallonia herrerae]|uniref:Ty3 transposon capsid-like protein domain-containing protein n=1 Tax=Escallonia herrerae TaxID=1293975 RepID=A0AA88WXD7_9ASTE|nr:hypothetical protein RJ639_031170 [Escallonia herrerae]